MGKVSVVRTAASAFAIIVALIPFAASAQVQGVSLNGRYQCVALCFGPPGGIAVVTQYGWQLNVVNDAGVPSRGWVDYPGGSGSNSSAWVPCTPPTA